MTQQNLAKFFSGDFASALPSSAAFPFDLSSLMETQRKNLEAFSAAQQIVFQSFQALAQRQGEILSQLVQDNAALVKEIANEGTPEEKVAKQTDLIKKNYEKTVANWRELSAAASKSGQEASDIVSERVTASLSELKSSMTKKAPVAGANDQKKKAA